MRLHFLLGCLLFISSCQPDAEKSSTLETTGAPHETSTPPTEPLIDHKLATQSQIDELKKEISKFRSGHRKITEIIFTDIEERAAESELWCQTLPHIEYYIKHLQNPELYPVTIDCGDGPDFHSPYAELKKRKAAIARNNILVEDLKAVITALEFANLYEKKPSELPLEPTGELKRELSYLQHSHQKAWKSLNNRMKALEKESHEARERLAQIKIEKEAFFKKVQKVPLKCGHGPWSEWPAQIERAKQTLHDNEQISLQLRFLIWSLQKISPETSSTSPKNQPTLSP